MKIDLSLILKDTKFLHFAKFFLEEGEGEGESVAYLLKKVLKVRTFPIKHFRLGIFTLQFKDTIMFLLSNIIL